MAMNRDKYFENAPVKEVEKLRKFRETHPFKQVEYRGIPLHYICSGKGDTGMLIFHGAAVNAEFVFNRVLDFERDYKVIAPNIAGFKTLDDLSDAVNTALEKEGIRRLIVLGGSMGGMLAQAYFKRNARKIDKLVLSITMAAKAERNRKGGLFIIKVLPFRLLRPLFKKKLGKLFDVEVPPGARDRVRFLHAHFIETLDTKTTKKTVLSQLKLVSEWNGEAPLSKEELKDWPGKVLVISCEDDPGYPDTEILLQRFPNADNYVFPKGAGHMVPLVHEKKYLEIIRNFLSSWTR